MPTVTKNTTRFKWEWKKEVWSYNNEKRYQTHQWKRLSDHIKTEEPFCRMCKENGVTKLAKVTDHIVAVRLGGDFWDSKNLQPLCESCHNGKKT